VAALDVDDAQPPGAEGDRPVRVEEPALVVGSAMDHRVVHRRDDRVRV
jgi:hypothetical protein